MQSISNHLLLIEHSRNVNACVALSRNIGISSLIFGPDVEKFTDSIGVELGDEVVSPSGGLGVHVRESYLRGRFNVEDVSFLVPAVFVVDHGSESIVDDEGSMLVEGSEKRRAARSSVEPDEDWVLFRCILGGEEEVVHVGGVVIEVKISGVPRLVVDGGDGANLNSLGLDGGEGAYNEEGYQHTFDHL